MEIFGFNKKRKNQTSDPGHLIISQYSDMPRFFTIDGATFDIDNPKDIRRLPLFSTTFTVCGKEYGMDLLLEKHGLQASSGNPEIYRSAMEKVAEYHSNGIIFTGYPNVASLDHGMPQVSEVLSSKMQKSANIEDIDKMDGHQFELWCAQLLLELGYSNVRLTGKSGDQGVDLLAEKDGVRYAIQCKCYSSNLGNTPVQEVNTGKIIYRCHVGAIMTNRYFTESAQEAADATGILLWDRNWISNGIKYRDSLSGPIKSADNVTFANNSVNFGSTHDNDNRLLPAAVDVVLTARQATVSLVQRRLKIGYAQAARLIDIMEERGIVGPFQGSKPRDVLITRSQWENMRDNP